MATLTLSTFLSPHSIAAQRTNLSISIPTSSSSPAFPRPTVGLRGRSSVVTASTRHWIVSEKSNTSRGLRKLRSSEDETLATEQEEEGEAGPSSDQQAVSVPVSPSDTLTMLFQADGTMSEAAIPAVKQSLEGLEGVSNLKIQVVEGIATVELEKLTTVQATGVASSLVESIQGSGFKLQALSLSFEDQEAVVV